MVTGVQGAFEVNGSALRAPEPSAWQYFVDAIVCFFTAWQVDVLGDARTAYWRATAFVLACGPQLSASEQDQLPMRLREALRRHGAYDEEFGEQIVEDMSSVVRRVQGDLTPAQRLAFVDTVMQPDFSERRAVLDLLGSEDWNGLLPLLRSTTFSQATAQQRRDMLTTLADDVDVPAVAHAGRELDAFFLAAEAVPVDFDLVGPTLVGSRSFDRAGIMRAVRFDLVMDGRHLAVFAPAAKADGYMPSLQAVATAVASLPSDVRAVIDEIDLSPGDQHDNPFASTSGGRHLTVFAQHGGLAVVGRVAEETRYVSSILAMMIAHEVGHILAMGRHGISASEWNEAVAHDLTRSTGYGNTDLDEEMAEVFKFYAMARHTHLESEYRERWPARFALFDRMMARYAADRTAYP